MKTLPKPLDERRSIVWLRALCTAPGIGLLLEANRESGAELGLVGCNLAVCRALTWQHKGAGASRALVDDQERRH